MNFQLQEYSLNLHGWNSTSPVFEMMISRVLPKQIIEVGSWYGGLAIHMANIIKQKQLNTKILCVDTWLGSLEHWEGFQGHLQLVEGFPTFYFQFRTNVILSGHQDIITAMPMPSLQAATYLQKQKRLADLIYMDASHDYDSMVANLPAYFQLLAPGGILFGDDYEGWPGVKDAVDQFIAARGYTLELVNGIYWIIHTGAI